MEDCSCDCECDAIHRVVCVSWNAVCSSVALGNVIYVPLGRQTKPRKIQCMYHTVLLQRFHSSVRFAIEICTRLRTRSILVCRSVSDSKLSLTVPFTCDRYGWPVCFLGVCISAAVNIPFGNKLRLGILLVVMRQRRRCKRSFRYTIT